MAWVSSWQLPLPLPLPAAALPTVPLPSLSAPCALPAHSRTAPWCCRVPGDSGSAQPAQAAGLAVSAGTVGGPAGAVPGCAHLPISAVALPAQHHAWSALLKLRPACCRFLATNNAGAGFGESSWLGGAAFCSWPRRRCPKQLACLQAPLSPCSLCLLQWVTATWCASAS